MEQTQIISPWVFYWIDVLSTLGFLSVLIVLCLITGTTLLLIVLNEELSREEFEEASRKILKVSISIIILCLIVNVSIPSQSTMYKMLIANEVTYERAETVIQVINEKVEMIMDRIDGK